MHRLNFIAFIIVMLMLASCGETVQDPITIEQAWIREAPPNASAMAGYMDITNHTNQDKKLIAANSNAFKVIEFHRSVEENGVYRMVRHENLIIPARGKFELKPGDYHLMLISPKNALHDGDKTSIELIFDDQSKVALEVAVKKAVFK